MRIHDVAEETGLTATAIRYYEKEGLLDHRHVSRQPNNYRVYNESAVERLKLVRKLQSVGFSLAELRATIQDPDDEAFDNLRVIEQLRGKIEEIKVKRDEFQQILETLDRMLEYRTTLMTDPKRARVLLRQWHWEQRAGEGRPT